MNIDDIRRDNCETIIRDHFDNNKSKLATALGKKSPTYISRWFSQSKQNRRNISTASAREIEEKAGLPDGWMDKDHSADEIGSHQHPDSNRLIPVITWEQAGKWHEIQDRFQRDDAKRWLGPPIELGEHAFILEVEGFVMQPDYLAGDFIFVDPAKPPENNNDVVIFDSGANQSTFRRLQTQDGKMYVHTINDRLRDTIDPLPEDSIICGVVVFSGRFRTRIDKN